MRLKQTWRWFGPQDPVGLQSIRQAGAEGIVTALHHIPHGNTWPKEEIEKRIGELHAAGFEWDVVESVTVHEDIKTRSGDYKKLIANYQETLRNLAASGVRTITYNFMPVNDWTRTSIDHPMKDGSKALYFNWVDLAVFDIHLLKRPHASDSYDSRLVAEAEKRFKSMAAAALEKLAEVILFGIPGEKKRKLEDMRPLLNKYSGATHEMLRQNLKSFLEAIVPVAEDHGLNMAIHPDDPPFDILGLPRIVSTSEDLRFILEAVPSASNGICFCTGSLGANPANDLPAMVQNVGDRLHFVHLRNVKRDSEGNFFEDDHLAGDTDMYAVVKEVLRVQQRIQEPIPFRPDHGHQMLDDLNKVTNPGYAAIGRLRGLAELRGLELGICKSEGW